jgi:hypothetical protein
MRRELQFADVALRDRDALFCEFLQAKLDRVTRAGKRLTELRSLPTDTIMPS